VLPAIDSSSALMMAGVPLRSGSPSTEKTITSPANAKILYRSTSTAVAIEPVRTPDDCAVPDQHVREVQRVVGLDFGGRQLARVTTTYRSRERSLPTPSRPSP
jgi:hypothetical protein